MERDDARPLHPLVNETNDLQRGRGKNSTVITGEGKRVHFTLCLLAGTDFSFLSGSRKERYLLLKFSNVFSTVSDNFALNSDIWHFTIICG